MNKFIFACVVFAAACACVYAGDYYHSAPSVAYVPVSSYYGKYEKPSYYQSYKPISLVAEPSNPSAAASAAASSATLNSGYYKPLVVPRYNIISGEPAYESAYKSGSYYH